MVVGIGAVDASVLAVGGGGCTLLAAGGVTSIPSSWAVLKKDGMVVFPFLWLSFVSGWGDGKLLPLRPPRPGVPRPPRPAIGLEVLVGIDEILTMDEKKER
jgi:hypothetical protein